ncbi:MAG: saccharopine dehydrogenase NADP-binding domain-containing protein [Longimicrobiales bacterium]
MKREPAIVVIGATGYTGALVARELWRSPAPHDPPVILAARDPARLAAVAEEVGAGATQTVDVTDPSSLNALIQPGDAVINTAGPFTELGEPVIRACIRAGAHYLDTTGEQPFMRAMRERHHTAAETAGVAVVNAMAFEYALGDCAAAVAAEGLVTPVRSLDVFYAWGGAASSVGTRRTVLRMLGRKAYVRRDGRFRLRPPGFRHRTVRLASGRTLHAVAFGAGEVVTVPRYLETTEARGWMVMRSTTARLVPVVAPILPLVIPILRPLLEPLVARKPDPTPAERENSAFTIRVELEGPDGTRRAAEVQGTDPYGLTAAATVRGARRAMAPDAPAGVLAPAQLLRPRTFLDSLAPRGVRLVLEPTPR